MHAWIKDRQKFTVMMCVIGLYVLTLSLAIMYRQARVTLWLIMPLSLLHLYFYGVIHELSHNNIFARVKLNIVAGYLLCPLNLVYFHTFKTVHLQHHRFAQVPVVDPVCTLDKNGTSYHPIWYLIIWPYYALRWYVQHICQHQNHRYLVRNFALYTAATYAVFGLGYAVGCLSTMLLFWALPVYIGTVFIIGIRNLIEHYGCEAPRYRTSRTLTNPVLNKLTFNSFFHLEHHLWPGATVAQLRELHERNADLYRHERAFIV